MLSLFPATAVVESEQSAVTEQLWPGKVEGLTCATLACWANRPQTEKLPYHGTMADPKRGDETEIAALLAHFTSARCWRGCWFTSI